MIERDDLIAALRSRYDHYSAESMLSAACERAGLEVLPAYAPSQVHALRAALA